MPRLGPLSGHVKRHVWAVRGACSAEEGEETRWRERRQGGGREVEVGECACGPRVVVDGLRRSGVGIVGENRVRRGSALSCKTHVNSYMGRNVILTW